MLLILQPDDVDAGSEKDKWVILTVQPRVPVGSLGFVEIPAGMLDGGTVKGAAMNEIREETGLEVGEGELVNMSELAAGEGDGLVETKGETKGETKAEGEDEAKAEGQEKLATAMYPSPGGSDEFIPIFTATKRVKREELEGWRGKLTGLREEGEKITLTLCRLEELWKVAGRDGKALAAWALYMGLKGEGKI